MVDKEGIGFLKHGLRGEHEPPLTTFLGRLDLKVAAAIEGLRRQFLEQLAVQRLRQSRSSEEQTMNFDEVLVGFDSAGGSCS